MEKHDDYIHTSMKIFSSMAKAGAKNLQEHQILLQMSIRLKELANKYNIFLATSTQLNNNHRENEALDDSALSGAKSIAQKVDVGAIMLPITKKDEAIIQNIMTTQPAKKDSFGLEPTHSISFYKNRGNPWKNTRLFIHFNMDTLEITDLFVTDYNGVLIPNIKPLKVTFVTEEDSLPESFNF